MGAIEKVLKPLIDELRKILGDDEIDEVEKALEEMFSKKQIFINDVSIVLEMLDEFKEDNLEETEDIWFGFGGWVMSIVEKISFFSEHDMMDKARAQFYVEEFRKLMKSPPRVLKKMRLLMMQLKGDVIKW